MTERPPVLHRYQVQVDGLTMCSGPFDEYDGESSGAHYLRAQMANYRDISPDSDVRVVITYAAAAASTTGATP